MILSLQETMNFISSLGNWTVCYIIECLNWLRFMSSLCLVVYGPISDHIKESCG